MVITTQTLKNECNHDFVFVELIGDTEHFECSKCSARMKLEAMD